MNIHTKKSYALITGASSGIGEEFAKILAKKGYPLILVARREERLLKLSKHLKTKTILIKADLSSESDRTHLSEILQKYDIEILINNAGFGDCGAFTETDLEKELKMIEVNIKAVHFLTKKLLLRMLQKNSGYILNTASCAGMFPAGPYMATYYASKAYVVSLTRAISHEIKEQGKNVYIGCLCPGPVNTEFNAVADVEFALKGIPPEYCARYALKKMFQRKTVIIPTLTIKSAVFFSKLLPSKTIIALTAHQQRRKLYR